MPVITVIPNGIVELVYTVAGLTHKMRFRCQISNPSGPAPYLLVARSGGTIDWGTATTELAAPIGALYSSATVFGNWVLSTQASGIYTPIDSVASSIVGTNSGADEACGEA